MVFVTAAGCSQIAARISVESGLEGQKVVGKSADTTAVSATMRGL